MSARILNALGILSSDVPTGNLVWVDAVNGIDALAMRGRMTIPFKTLAKAKAAAKSGDTIMVLPGTYNENDLASNGVNWHFLNGAVVEYSGTGSAIFDTSGGTCTFKVTGDGVFKTTNGSGIRAFSFSNTADVVTLEFDWIEATSQAIYSAGKLRASGNETKSTGSTAVEIRGSSENLLDIFRIESSGGQAVFINGDNANCIVRLHAHFIVSSTSYTLYFAEGTAYVDAFEVSASGGGAAIQYGCASSHPLHLRVSRIVSTLNDTGARAISIASGSAAIRLYGCAIFSKYGDYAISAASASDVLCLQQCVIKAKTTATSGSSNVTAKIQGFLDITNVTNFPGIGDL